MFRTKSHIKLAAVAVLAAICHAHHACRVVIPRQPPGLVLELAAIYGVAPPAVAPHHVPALGHEARHHAVEGGTGIAQRLAAAFSGPFLAGAQASKVFGRLWGLRGLGGR